MKNVLLVVVVLLLCLGCERENPMREYERSRVETYQKTQKVSGTANIRYLQDAIKAYHAANERYPADLNELADYTGKAIDSSLYSYDPSTGTLTPRQ